jgi:hypothetical protein
MIDECAQCAQRWRCVPPLRLRSRCRLGHDKRRKFNDFRNTLIVFCQLPKLDVVSSSPIARSESRCRMITHESLLPVSAAGAAIVS